MEQEKKNRMLSLYTTIGVHAILLVVFFLALAWTAPDPPIPEYGIELSLGELITEETADAPTEVEETVEDVVEEAAPLEEQVETEPVTEEATAAEMTTEEQTITEDINSPDIVDEESTEKVSTEEPIKDETDDSNDEEKVEVVEPVKEVPKINEKALYKKTDGDPKPASKGASLDLSGWEWDFRPTPNDKSQESGKIVFQITVDDEGEIINVRTLEKTVSPLVEKSYRDAVMDLTFSPTADNRSTAPTSTGRITFIIQSK
ncbi:MAG: hypothetical protein JXR07_13805 [Reichenbachiella sp.]